MIKKVQKADDDDEFEEIINHLVKLKDKLNKKIDDLKKKCRKQNQQNWMDPVTHTWTSRIVCLT